jgi:hypothetical protein
MYIHNYTLSTRFPTPPFHPVPVSLTPPNTTSLNPRLRNVYRTTVADSDSNTESITVRMNCSLSFSSPPRSHPGQNLTRDSFFLIRAFNATKPPGGVMSRASSCTLVRGGQGVGKPGLLHTSLTSRMVGAWADGKSVWRTRAGRLRGFVGIFGCACG